MTPTDADRERWRRHILDRCLAQPPASREAGSGCWIWQLAVGSHGYGATRIPGAPKASVTTASRLAFRAWNGELAIGEEPRHTCHNKLCCNPDHLVRGSHRDNVDDSAAAGHLARKLTPELVRRVREMSASGGTLRGIAAKVGVCSKTVWQVLTGKTWTHVV